MKSIISEYAAKSWRRLRSETPDSATLPGVTLVAALDAFYLEHRDCGELDGAVDGDRVSIWRSFRAVLGRRVHEEGER